MEQILGIVTTIVRDWWIIVLAFTAGGVYLQGQQWFSSVNKNLADAQDQRAHGQESMSDIIAILADMQHNMSEMKGAMHAVTAKSSQHETELIRNTEQHAAIVKALEGHVGDNREHDQSVKASLAVIMDRLSHK